MASAAQELALLTHPDYSDQNTEFRQQTGTRWQPKMTRFKSITLCGVIGVLLLIVGGGLYASVDSIVQTDVVYYHQAPVNSNPTVQITIPKAMSKPVYVYYKIENFFQSHRRYVISRDERQLRGLGVSSPTTCAPLTRFADLTSAHSSFAAPANSSADADKVLYPCGLAAVTAFNDVMSACVTPASDRSGPCNPLSWSKAEIDYPSDEKKYLGLYDDRASGFDPAVMTVSSPFNGSRLDPTSTTGARLLPRLGDEDLTVWMRMAATSTFHKLYRVIDQNLEEGDVVSITIQNSWDVTPFDGKKGIVLATQHFLGGKSFTLPICYMVVGAMCILEAVFVFVLTRWCPGYTPIEGR